MRFLLILFQALYLVFHISAAEADPKPCLQWVQPLEVQANHILSDGGMWALYERHPELRNYSMDALQLDSRINKIIGMLKYLCQTQDGIPLNDLAQYLTYNIKAMGIVRFRVVLSQLGKSPEEIDTWLEFAHYAKQQEFRLLEIDRIRKTINSAKPWLSHYEKLAEGALGQSAHESHREAIRSLSHELDQFLSDTPYLAQAIDENSRIPYWDINESTGGS